MSELSSARPAIAAVSQVHAVQQPLYRHRMVAHTMMAIGLAAGGAALELGGRPEEVGRRGPQDNRASAIGHCPSQARRRARTACFIHLACTCGLNNTHERKPRPIRAKSRSPPKLLQPQLKSALVAFVASIGPFSLRYLKGDCLSRHLRPHLLFGAQLVHSRKRVRRGLLNDAQRPTVS